MNRDSRAVSPVIAVILMVAVTVVLSAAIGAFVFDIGQSTTGAKQQSLGVSTSQSDNGTEVTVVTGEADEMKVLLNGEPAKTIQSPQPGDFALVRGVKGDEVTVVSSKNGEQKVLTTTTVSSTASIQEGLIAHYRIEKGSGDTVYDTIATNEGTINGATWSSGPFRAERLSFDGTDHIDIGADLDVPPSGFTIAVWARVPSSNSDFGSIVDLYDGSYGEFRLYKEDSTHGDDVIMVVGDPTNGTGAAVRYGLNVSDGKWRQYVGVFNGSGIKVYYNTSLVDTATGVSTVPDNDANWEIGRRLDDNSYWDGEIDDVRVYNRALTQSEVQSLYNMTK